MLKSNFEEYEQKKESTFDFVVLYQNHCMCYVTLEIFNCRSALKKIKL